MTQDALTSVITYFAICAVLFALLGTVLKLKKVPITPLVETGHPFEKLNWVQLALFLTIVPLALLALRLNSIDTAISAFSLFVALFVFADSNVLFSLKKLRQTGEETAAHAVKVADDFKATQDQVAQVKQGVERIADSSKALLAQIDKFAAFEAISTITEACDFMKAMLDDVHSEDCNDVKFTFVAATPIVGATGASDKAYREWFKSFTECARRMGGNLRVICLNIQDCKTFHKKILDVSDETKLTTIAKDIDDIFDAFDKQGVNVQRLEPEGILDSKRYVPYLHFLIRHEESDNGFALGKAVVWQLKPPSATKQGGSDTERRFKGSGFWVKDSMFIDTLLAVYSERSLRINLSGSE